MEAYLGCPTDEEVEAMRNALGWHISPEGVAKILRHYEPRSSEQLCDGSGWIASTDVNTWITYRYRCPAPGCSRCKPKKTPKSDGGAFKLPAHPNLSFTPEWDRGYAFAKAEMATKGDGSLATSESTADGAMRERPANAQVAPESAAPVLTPECICPTSQRGVRVILPSCPIHGRLAAPVPTPATVDWQTCRHTQRITVASGSRCWDCGTWLDKDGNPTTPIPERRLEPTQEDFEELRDFGNDAVVTKLSVIRLGIVAVQIRDILAELRGKECKS